MQLEPAVPSMFVGAAALMLADAGGANTGWMGAVLQGGALILLTGVLYVIFREFAPRFLEELKSHQEARQRDHIDFIKALSDMRESHMVEMARARESHEKIIRNLTESLRGCEFGREHSGKKNHQH